MNRLLLVLVALVGVVLAGCGDDDSPVGVSGGGRIIHVPLEEPTIQAGIEAASAGDTVLVACGTYYEHHIEMKSGVYLTSDTGQADCVTIDGQEQGRVFYCSDVDSHAAIVGFTIANGLVYHGGGGISCYSSALTVKNCTFTNNAATSDYVGNGGGGMFCRHSSPTLIDCVFQDNQASGWGGGMYCRDASSPKLENCLFDGNSAGYGGGMFCYTDSSPTLLDCAFSYNQAEYHGGGLFCYTNSSCVLTECTFSHNHAGGGGAASFHSSSVLTLTNCTFESNEAELVGGAVFSWTRFGFTTLLTFTDCTFVENRANSHGGALLCLENSPELTGCTFQDNQASSRGGAMFCGHCSPVLTNCTFSGNAATNGGGMGCELEASPTLTNCIIAFGPDGDAIHCSDESCTPLLECCDVYGNAGGDWVGCIANQYGVGGNFSEDPLFCAMGNRDLTLASNSPCLPGGNECGVLLGAYGEGCP